MMKEEEEKMMMLEQKTTDFLQQLSSAAPFPGGGGASAAVGAFAAALGLMVANLTVGKKRYADAEEEIIRVRERLYGLQQDLVRLADADAEAFEPLAEAYRLPKETPEERAEKERVMEGALVGASRTPLAIMEKILESMELLEVLCEKGSRLAQSDVGAGILFAQAALEGASLNVLINTKMMKDREAADEMKNHALELIQTGRAKKDSIYERVLSGIS